MNIIHTGYTGNLFFVNNTWYDYFWFTDQDNQIATYSIDNSGLRLSYTQAATKVEIKDVQVLTKEDIAEHILPRLRGNIISKTINRINI